ncbi:6f35361c-224d-49ec-91f8-8722643389b5 [Thermothielavioides terrestris]|uniref:6f35361c-224d-49ec-91f8-8722643389b5 n=1 Tax=Thermothielavioides terrestris TaxID=2587410 RepID=A0A3S4B2G6_9PEZI|nr:6f35361c-224d-49ec-91f8-8722643389b5 [Thermothielavioides terrestris]
MMFPTAVDLNLSPPSWFLTLNLVTIATYHCMRRFDFQLAFPYRPRKSVNFNPFLQNDTWVAVTLREKQAEE